MMCQENATQKEYKKCIFKMLVIFMDKQKHLRPL